MIFCAVIPTNEFQSQTFIYSFKEQSMQTKSNWHHQHCRLQSQRNAILPHNLFWYHKPTHKSLAITIQSSYCHCCKTHNITSWYPLTETPLLWYNQYISPAQEMYLKNCHSQRKHNYTMPHSIIVLMNPLLATAITNCNQTDWIVPLYYYESNASNSQHQQ